MLIRFCSVIFLSALLFSCSNHAPTTAPLVLNSITTDDKSNQNIRQIRFKFNQPIAHMGAIPDTAQTAAITMSSTMQKQCVWRFTQLDTLTCELTQPLDYLRNYHIGVSTAFSALGNSLAQSKSHTIRTVFPKQDIDINYHQEQSQFFKKVEIHVYQNPLNSPPKSGLSKLLTHTKLKLPNGQYHPLQAELKPFSYQTSLLLTPAPTKQNWQQGRYQLVLPKGTALSAQHRTLEKEITLDTFFYYPNFSFHGFACTTKNRDPVDIALTPTGILPCPPEKVSLGFSVPITQVVPYPIKKRQPKDWLTGGKVDFGRFVQHQGISYFNLRLQGNTRYRLDLSKVTNFAKETLQNPQIIDFVTQESTPDWFIENSSQTVLEPNSPDYVRVVRRNVATLNANYRAINSKEALLRFLNKPNQLPHLDKTLIEPTAAKTTLAAQKLAVREYLTQPTGLVQLTLQGEGLTKHDFHYGWQSGHKSRTMLVNVAGYNLAVWHQQDLLLQAISWQGAFLANAQVYLVCQSHTAPQYLGQTTNEGLLWIKAKRWQSLYQPYSNKTCWLWTQHPSTNANGQAHSLTSAAIQLPKAETHFSDLIKPFVWSAQPVYQQGETVNLGWLASKRTPQGLTPVTQLSDYQLSLEPQGNHAPIVLTLSSATEQGFSHAAYTLPTDAPLGNYTVTLTHLPSGQTQRINDFDVVQFTPPEFEHRTTLPTEVFKGQTATINVHGQTMSGAALVGAKVKLRYRIEQRYSESKHWPEDYTFSSWEDYYEHTDKDNKWHKASGVLNSAGQWQWTTPKLNSAAPYAELAVHTEIIAPDGQTQTSRHTIPYFSRDYYLGTRFDEKTQQLHLVAINKQGKPINQLATTVIATIDNETHKSDAQPAQPIEVKRCTFSRLPARCAITQQSKQIHLAIDNPKQGYTWYRSIAKKHTPSPQELFKPHELSLTSKQKQLTTGDTLNLVLHSPRTGVASFILQAGTVKKVWQQHVVQGSNTITLQSDASWQPYIRVYTSLAIPRSVANKRLQQQFQQFEKNKDELSGLELLRLFNNIQSGRRLSAQLQLFVKTKAHAPHITLDVPKTVQGAGTLRFSIHSTTDAQSQIWLVNEALLPLYRITHRDFDYQDKLTSRYAFEPQLAQHSLDSQLVLNATMRNNGSHLADSKAAGSVMMRSRGALPAFNMPSIAINDSTQNTVADFALSRWLPVVNLRKNTKQQLEVKLPQLLGRWKIFALSATNNTMTISQASVNAVRDVEYYLDAPKQLVYGDSSYFSVTQINQTASAINDTLSVFIDGKKIQQRAVSLPALGYQRSRFSLPALPVGQHVITLKSHAQPDFIATQTITVAANTWQVEKSWLVTEKNKHHQVSLPPAALSSSIELSYLPTGSLAPNWQALSLYTEQYPHQCWEQTLSRAISYQFNPLAKTLWPKGETQLTNLLNQDSDAYSEGYSYFPNQLADSFLTAYTYLAHHWLKDTSTSVTVNKAALKKTLLKYINRDNTGTAVNTQTRSMALFALAVNRDIDLPQALTLRQKIGAGNAYSNALQALALKELGADDSLYLPQLLALYNQGYQDKQSNVFNHTSGQCAGALVFDKTNPKRAELIKHAIQKQLQTGNFGSTFANALCSYLLHTENTDAPVNYQTLAFSHQQGTLTYPLPQPHWLKLRYQQAINTVKPRAEGLQLSRQLFVRSAQDTWQKVAANHSLKVGDIVKTVLTLRSPVARDHVTLSDPFAGAIEAINPNFSNQFYHQDNKGRRIDELHHFMINNHKATWYVQNLEKGVQQFAYYGRVRHEGKFNVPPATAQTMYRDDIYANTTSNNLKILANLNTR